MKDAFSWAKDQSYAKTAIWWVSLTPPPFYPYPYPFIFQKELIQYQYNFMQLLNNQSKVVQRLKNADINCYMLT